MSKRTLKAEQKSVVECVTVLREQVAALPPEHRQGLMASLAALDDVLAVSEPISEVETERGVLQAIIDAVPVPLAYMDAEFNLVYINEAYAQATGRDAAALIGSNHFDSFSSAEHQRIFARARDRGARVVHHADRQDWTLTPVQDAQGVVLGLVLAVNIHHEHLRRELAQPAQLERNEARFRAIFENMGIGVALLDEAGRILTANPVLLALLGYDSAALMALPWANHFHPDDVDAYTAHFAALMASQQQRYHHEGVLLGKDGRKIWVDMTVSLIRGARGHDNFAVVAVKDISQRRQAQEALVQTEKLALTGRLAASLAHEINNPLQTVSGCLGLAREIWEEGGDVGEFLDIGLEELKRTAGIVSSLRDLNRRSEPEEREPFDVIALVKRLPVLIRMKCRDRHVILTWQVEEDVPEILGVADRIQQVFLNLVLNALDAMPEGGKLHISVAATEQPSGISVAFEDTGVGMSTDKLAQLFDAFYTTKTRGLGLGLFSSHTIVEDHGGHIDVESQPGEGSTFTVWLPAASPGEHPQEKME